MKLLTEIPKDRYNDVTWVLNHLHNNETIGNEETTSIEYFHCFWKGNMTDLHYMCLRSLFDIHPDSKVILWTMNALETQGTFVWLKTKKLFKNNITILEITKEHFKEADMERFYPQYVLLTMNDRKTMLTYASDIIRFMVLYLYGGVWFDMDMFFLRNFDSIKLNRYVSQWGTDMCGNGAILKLEKGHDLIGKIVKMYPEKPFYPFTPKHPELSSFVLENDLNITMLPATFFDILWCKDLPEDLQFKKWEDFFKTKELRLPKEIYAYHWHNQWDKEPPPFFKF